MKKGVTRIIVIIATFACVVSAAFFFSSKHFSPYRYYSFVKMPPLIHHFAAGELVDGKIVEQHLFLSEKHLRVNIPQESSFCVGALMATYFDRKNEGKVRLSVQFPEGSVLMKEIPFSEMKDNKYHKVCFDYPFNRLHSGEYTVILEGIGGKEGSSATVWLTKNMKPPFTSNAKLNGKTADGVLVAGILARQKVPVLPYPLIALVALYATLVAFLVFILFPRKNY
jgi:hypothetical protein